MINGIDAMKDVDGARELAIKAQKAQNDRILVFISDPGWVCPCSGPTRSSRRSLPRSLKGPAWACPSATPSLNRMAGACGLPTTLRAAQVFIHSAHQSRGKGMNPDG